MWNPNYTITDRLLSVIRQIGEVMGELKSRQINDKDFAKLIMHAKELSTYASTSIEGNPLRLTDVKYLMKHKKENIRDTEREVLNYNKALEFIHAKVESNKFVPNVKTLEHTQHIVIDNLLDNPQQCGNIRQEPVVIRNPRKIDEIVFIPPDAKDIPKLLDDMFSYINTNLHKVDPIILAGLFHKQCVVIHPFMDGNGRTTRLFTTAILGMTGLNLFKIFSFENYYNNNITRYFRYVGLEGDYYEQSQQVEFTDWLEYFAEGILDELKRVQKTLPDSNDTTSYRLEPFHRQILDYIKEHGSITQREYAEITNRSLASRKLDFEKLLSFGLISVEGAGRARYYVMSKK